MDNQPVAEPSANSPDQAPVQPTEPTTTPAVEPTGAVAGDVVLESGKKKRKKLIITLVSIFAVLLIGGGAFAAFAIIYNQPNNIIMSALNNLFNAKQIGVNGTINLGVEDSEVSEVLGINTVNIKIDDQSAGINNSATATLNIGFTNGESASLNLGETMVSNGTFYLKANGLEDFYNNVVYDMLKSNLLYQTQPSYQSTLKDCNNSGATTNCVTIDEESSQVDPAVSATADNMLNKIGEIIAGFDDQWFEFSIGDIVKSEMLGITEAEQQKIVDSYNCTINLFNRIPDYSAEFSNLYVNNQFIVMTPGQDSFYNISFDPANLTSYINASNNTKFANDLKACYDNTEYSIPGETADETTVDEVSSMLESAPQISAKFDGIFSHHLTELKITQTNDSASLSTDLNFSYPGALNITAPTESRPIMEVVEETYQQIMGIMYSNE